MSVTYTATTSDGLEVRYRDRKRWAWMLSMLWPLMPFVGLAAHHATGIEAALALPLLISYGLMPLLDALIGEDPNNPPDAVVRQLDADRYYRWLTWATVPLHFLALIGCAWWAGTQDLSWWASLLLLAYVAGTDAGLGLNTAHELGHKNNPLEQWLARLALAVPAYGHFTVEHGRGHHRWVATPEDHASARMGESIYHFAWRELPGGIRRARAGVAAPVGAGVFALELAQHHAAVLRRHGHAAGGADRLAGLEPVALPGHPQPRRLVATDLGPMIEHYGLLREATPPQAPAMRRPSHTTRGTPTTW